MPNGMFEAPRRYVNRVFLHCSASGRDIAGQALVELITEWHLARTPPFAEIGYHFIIDKKGNIMEGRSLEKQPAAQAGHNAKTIAICVHGLTFPQTWYNASAQSHAVVQLCQQINYAYSGVIAFWPHNAVSNKSCPVFDIDKLLELDKWRRMP